LAKLFGSTSRIRILSFLFEYTGQSFYQRQIMFEAGLALQPAQRELMNLVELGIIKKHETDNRVYYQVNTDSPFFNPLRDIFSLTGATEVE
jgi:predicted transcriptional regulator